VSEVENYPAIGNADNLLFKVIRMSFEQEA